MKSWWTSRALILLTLAATIALGFFLLSEGRAKSDQWMSVVSGSIAVGGVAIWVIRFALHRGSESSGKEISESIARRLLYLRDNRPPKTREVGPFDLGVKPSIASFHEDTSMPTYVPRLADDDLAWAIAQGGIVLLHGRAASGKTRTAFEAIQRLRPDYDLLVPAYPTALRELVDTGYEIRDSIVWLDDLDQVLASDGLDELLVQRICQDRRHDVVIVATIRDDELARMTAEKSFTNTQESAIADVNQAARRLLRAIRGRRRIKIEQYLSEAERSTAGKATDARVIDALAGDVGFAEYLAAGPAMLERWSTGDGPLFEIGQALISGAVDCRRIGLSRPIPKTALSRLYLEYLPKARRARADLPSIDEGLAWASRPVLAASSCLEPRDDHAFLAADYLVDRAQAGEGPLSGAPISDHAWEAVLDIVTHEQLLAVGTRAYEMFRLEVAERAFRLAVNANEGKEHEGHSMRNLAILLAQRGEAEEAEIWYRRAADKGDAGAMTNLGLMVAGRGEVVEAEKWYRKALAEKLPETMHNLGNLLYEQGRLQEAESAYRQAISAGHSRSMVNLGNLLSLQHRAEEAESWYRTAMEAGEASAMTNLAVEYIRRNKVAEAEVLYRRAIEADSPEAMHNYAIHLSSNGRTVEAEALYRRAIEAGYTGSMINLGNLLQDREENLEAEHWFRRSVDAGDPAGRLNLGSLLYAIGRYAEAELWYGHGIQAGDIECMSNLGVLLLATDRAAEAKEWFQRAAAAGSAAAMQNLRLLAQREQGA